jgi:elongation factor P
MTYTDLTSGVLFMYENQPFIVVSSEFHRAQARKAVVRTQIRNLITGQLLQKTFTAADQFDPAPVNDVEVSYLYQDEDFCHFMNSETYEQYQVNKEILGEKIRFLTEETRIMLRLFDGNPIGMEIPKNVHLKVVESPNVIRGNTASATFKTVVCENEIPVSSCPLFIKEGDVIKVNTDTGEYQERVRN